MRQHAHDAPFTGHVVHPRGLIILADPFTPFSLRLLCGVQTSLDSLLIGGHRPHIPCTLNQFLAHT